MERSGAENTYENKQLLDKIVREILGMERERCPDVWRRVKDVMFSGDDAERKDFEDAVVKAMVKRLITG
jgi:hypothetical protein